MLDNDALRQFAHRWELDGDYLRCRDCNRPQLASYAANEFQHSADCRAKSEPRPWETLASLLSPAAPPAPAKIRIDLPDGTFAMLPAA